MGYVVDVLDFQIEFRWRYYNIFCLATFLATFLKYRAIFFQSSGHPDFVKKRVDVMNDDFWNPFEISCSRDTEALQDLSLLMKAPLSYDEG